MARAATGVGADGGGVQEDGYCLVQDFVSAYLHRQRYYPLTEDQVRTAECRWINETILEAPEAIDASLLPDAIPLSDATIIARSTLSKHPFKMNYPAL